VLQLESLVYDGFRRRVDLLVSASDARADSEEGQREDIRCVWPAEVKWDIHRYQLLWPASSPDPDRPSVPAVR